MLKFIKILFLPVAAFIFLACQQLMEGKNPEGFGAKFQNIAFDSSVHNKYPWLSKYSPKNNIVNRIGLPEGFERAPVEKNSFADWLRHLPLKEDGSKVNLYNGEPKSRQDVHSAVIDIDAGGKEDLQQCADACMRLRAEYLYSVKKHDKINFKFTSGDNASWVKWTEGYRPKINGNKVTWAKTGTTGTSHDNFKSYMKTVFRYCGTYSLGQELKSINVTEMKIGDVFIKGGFPGHAVTILDMAENKKTGEKIFIISQSYMPAQDIHILKNFNNENFSPWYSVNFGSELDTPEWTFDKTSLKRFQF